MVRLIIKTVFITSIVLSVMYVLFSTGEMYNANQEYLSQHQYIYSQYTANGFADFVHYHPETIYKYRVYQDRTGRYRINIFYVEKYDL